VAAAGIGEQLIEQIAMPVPIPQMMMRVDDLERRLQDLLLALSQPRGIWIARGGAGGTLLAPPEAAGAAV
jgi:hypothetical protein